MSTSQIEKIINLDYDESFFIEAFNDYNGDVYIIKFNETIDFPPYLITDFIKSKYPSTKVKFFSDSQANIIISDDLKAYMSISSGESYFEESDNATTVYISAGGSLEKTKEFNSLIKNFFDNIENKAHYGEWWFLSKKGGITNISLKVKPMKKFNQLCYPYIENIEEFINGFYASDAPVMIFLGPPGLGKTSILKYMINRDNLKVVTTYDEKVMEDDSFYMSFIRSKNDLLILEDADRILRERKLENSVMSKLLNVSDGIFSLDKKKIIFTTNAEKREIDEAILRPGRCYKLVEFRPLTRLEAEALAESLGKELTVNKSEYTLAEIFSGQNQSKNKFGFR
jgi:hypothetical protein